MQLAMVWTQFWFLNLLAAFQFKVFGMPSYRFKFYDPNSRSEKLGSAVLAMTKRPSVRPPRSTGTNSRRRKAIRHVEGGNHRERPQSRGLFVCTGSKGSRVK